MIRRMLLVVVIAWSRSLVSVESRFPPVERLRSPLVLLEPSSSASIRVVCQTSLRSRHLKRIRAIIYYKQTHDSDSHNDDFMSLQ